MSSERSGAQLKDVSVLPEPEIDGYMIQAKISADAGVSLGIEVSNTLRVLNDEQTVRKTINGVPTRIVGYVVTETGEIDWVLNMYSEDIKNRSTKLDDTSW